MKLLIHDYAGHPFPISLSRQLAKRGHEVTHAFASQLLTPRGTFNSGTPEPETLKFAEVPMSPDYRRHKYSFLKRRSYEREYGVHLAALTQRLCPDLILSGQTPTEPQLTLLTAAGEMSVPVVTWIQDFYSMAVDRLARKKLPVIGALAGAWYKHLDALCFDRSAGIVAITDDFIPILARFRVPPSKITVIPNWAPLDELPLKPRKNLWTGRHGLDGKFVFLYSGTLAMKHNPELLQQLAMRYRDDPEVRIVVVSEGPGADFLRQRKAKYNLENLLLLPFQDFGDMPDVLAAADVLVTVLDAEAGVFSVPSKVLTYLTAKRPLLAAIPSGNLAARIIKSEESGLCVDPLDQSGWLAAADKLRNHAEVRDVMSRNGRAYAEREFEIERITNRFEDVFAKAIGG